MSKGIVLKSLVSEAEVKPSKCTEHKDVIDAIASADAKAEAAWRKTKGFWKKYLTPEDQATRKVRTVFLPNNPAMRIYNHGVARTATLEKGKSNLGIILCSVCQDASLNCGCDTRPVHTSGYAAKQWLN